MIWTYICCYIRFENTLNSFMYTIFKVQSCYTKHCINKHFNALSHNTYKALNFHKITYMRAKIFVLKFQPNSNINLHLNLTSYLNPPTPFTDFRPFKIRPYLKIPANPTPPTFQNLLPTSILISVCTKNHPH